MVTARSGVMNLSQEVLEALAEQKGLTFVDRSVYLWMATMHPRSIRAAARQLHLGWRSIECACRKLKAAGWMEIRGGQAGLVPVPLLPVAVQTTLASRLEERYDAAANRGEFLMLRLLDLMVRSEHYIDFARMEWLANPLTDQKMELDRYYPKFKVAFEYNGSLHHPPARQSSDEAIQAHREQRTRDLCKSSLCLAKGVELVVITAEDLLLDAFELRLPPVLPRNNIDKDGPYCRALGRIAAAYAARVRRGQ
jgi:hypothetical protein